MTNQPAPQLDLFILNGERTVDLADVFGYGPSAPGWKEPKRYPDPPHRGRATQVIAADKVKPAAPSMRARVLAFIGESGASGATRQEIADGLGMLIQTVCGRVSELVAVGDIREDEVEGKVRTRDSRAVLVAVPE